ncbi:MAG: vWA domain-containing protein [archaeon]
MAGKSRGKGFLNLKPAVAAKGFAISIDALLATVLVLGAIAFVGFGLPAGNEATKPAEMGIRQAVDDAFTALDNTGTIMKTLVDQETQDSAENIRLEAMGLLPENTGLKVKITEFVPKTDLATCRDPLTRSFEECFEQQGEQLEAGEGIPGNKEILHGRKLIMAGGLGRTLDNQCRVINEFAGKEEKQQKAMLDDAEKSIDTQVMVTDSEMRPLESLECCENPDAPTSGERAVVTMKIRDASRDPIALMLVLDKSSSMTTYDMGPKPISPEGVATISSTPATKGTIGCTIDSDCPQDYGFFEVCNNGTCMMRECSGPSDSGVSCNTQSCADNDCGTNETCQGIGTAGAKCVPATCGARCVTDADCLDPDVFYCTGGCNARCEVQQELNCFSTRFMNCPNIDTPAEIKSDLDWQYITTFTVGNGAANDVDLDSIDNGGRIEVGAENSSWGPLISSPVLKLRAPNGTDYIISSGGAETSSAVRSVFIQKSILASNTGTWSVYGWSFRSWTNNPIRISKENAGDLAAGYPYDRFVREIATNIPVSGGTKTGSSGECSGFSGWQEVASFTIPADTSVWGVDFKYSAYPTAPECESRFQVLAPGETLGNGQTSRSSITTASEYGAWNVATIYNWTTGSFTPGTYRVYYWSMVPSSQPQLVSVGYRINTRIKEIAQWNTDGRGRCKEADGKFRRYRIVADPNTTAVLNWNNDVVSFEVPAGVNLNGIYAEGWTDYFDGKFNQSTHCRPLWKIVSPTGWNPTENYSYFSFGTPTQFGSPPETLYGRGQYCIDQWASAADVLIPQCSNWTVWNQSDTGGKPVDNGIWNIDFWSDEQAKVSARWYFQRIDSAKIAAMNFISDNGWKTDDALGLVAYNGNVLPADIVGIDSNRLEVIDALRNLSASGGTATALAIKEAREELESATQPTKYIVLLTDGKANVCTSQPPYSTNCPTDPNNCCEAQATADAIQEAEEAREQGITIFVIGFADSTLIGSYEDKLRQVAKDENTDYCDDGIACGKYYFAEDEQVLQEIYDEIANEIRTLFGLVQVEEPLPEGMQLADEANPGKFGIWDDSTGSFTEKGSLEWNGDSRTLSLPIEGQSIHYSGDLWFAIQFEAILPCSGKYCRRNYVTFPPEETKITDNDDQSIIYWADELEPGKKYCDARTETCLQPVENKFLMLPFEYRDLKIAFTGGTIEPGNQLKLDLKIENIGYKDVDLRQPKPNLEITFEKKETGEELQASCDGGMCTVQGIQNANLHATVETGSVLLSQVLLCKTRPDSSQCNTGTSTDQDIGLNISDILFGEGKTIIARMNQDGTVLECAENNESYIYCGTEKFRFFAIDYYAWVK